MHIGGVKLGYVENITADKFPRQSAQVGKRVKVHLSSGEETGKVVRDDAEAPFVTIIQLKGGRYILDEEKEIPKQDEWLGKMAAVCFHRDTRHQIGGRFVRDDATGIRIIKLNDGRYVLGAECQYRV